MRVGITGSTGFIGSALVSALRRRGDEVVRFVRPDSTVRDGSIVRWNPTTGDLDDGDLQSAGRFDAVVNLAGAGMADRRWSDARKKVIMDSRVHSTSLLVEALASARGTMHLVSASAIGVYGADVDQTCDESAPAGDDFLASVCLAWEETALTLEQHGAVVSLVRSGIVLDASGGALKKQLPLFRAGFGGVLGTGRQWQSVISLDDQVNAILWILDHPMAGAINLVSPTPVTNRQFTNALAQTLHRPAAVRVPAFALRLVLGDELVRTAVLASQRVVPAALLADGFSFSAPDLESILASALAPNR
ncbi:MAG: TIGR01777 family oxidoreductase [Acidimicrobiales bacterium]